MILLKPSVSQKNMNQNVTNEKILKMKKSYKLDVILLTNNYFPIICLGGFNHLPIKFGTWFEFDNAVLCFHGRLVQLVLVFLILYITRLA